MVFEPTIPASARPQTYALDRAATGIGSDTRTGDVMMIGLLVPLSNSHITRVNISQELMEVSQCAVARDAAFLFRDTRISKHSFL
jgi:hypothetical protein